MNRKNSNSEIYVNHIQHGNPCEPNQRTGTRGESRYNPSAPYNPAVWQQGRENPPIHRQDTPSNPQVSQLPVTSLTLDGKC